MESSIVTTKGQVVIPSWLRKKFGIKNGTKVNFSEGNGEIKMIPITSELIKKNFGFMGTKGKMLKSLMEDKKKEREL